MWTIFSPAKLVGIPQLKINVLNVAFSFSVDWDVAVVHPPSRVLWWGQTAFLNLDHKFSGMCIWAGRHAEPSPLQYIEEHLRITDNYAQSSVPM